MKDNNINNKEVGKRLQEYRTQRGITQVQISKAIGISRSGYGDYEYGNCQIPLESLLKMAKFFCITPTRLNEILGINKNQFQNTDLEIVVNDFIDNLKNQTIILSGQALNDDDLMLFETMLHNSVNQLKKIKG